MSIKILRKKKINENKQFISKFLVVYLAGILALGTVIPAVLAEPSDSWWNPAWNYRKLLTINTSQVSGVLVNYPMLVQMVDSDVASHAQPSGNDIVFILYSDNTTQLNHEIEYYNSATGMICAWVNITRLSALSNTKIWMYYGNPAAGVQQDIIGTWDNMYMMVQHLNETGSVLSDSTGYQNNGVSTGTNATSIGKIDGGRLYNGNDRIVVNNFTHSPTALTIEAWVYRDNTDYIYIADKGIYSQTDTDWIIYLRNNQPANQGIDFSIRNHSCFIRAGDTPVGSWFYLSATYESGSAALYLNATILATASGWSSLPNRYPHLGLGNDYLGNEGATYPMTDVRLDEIRVSNTARNSSWISTCYHNQMNPAGFFSLGNEEQYPTSENQPPIFGTPSPVNGSSSQPLSLTWSIPISDPEGDMFSWTIHGSNGQTNSASGASNGTKSLSLTGLAYGTTYTIWVNATDPSGSNLYTRRWYTLTTQAGSGNNPPLFGIPAPANNSISQPSSLTWSISMNDPEGDLFTWSIECSNGHANSGSGESNGTKTITLVSLAYATTYKVWVNATDPAGSTMYTRRWYMFTTGQAPAISVVITKPVQDTFYFNDVDKHIAFPGNTIVYGKITITVNVTGTDITTIEYYVDGKPLTDSDPSTPYTCEWQPLISFNANLSLKRTIKVIVYDAENNTASAEVNITKWRFHPLPFILAGISYASRLVPHTTVVGVFYNVQQSRNRITSFYALRANYKTVSLFERSRGVLNFKHCTGGILIGPMTLTHVGLSHKIAIGSFTVIGHINKDRVGLGSLLRNLRS